VRAIDDQFCFLLSAKVLTDLCVSTIAVFIGLVHETFFSSEFTCIFFPLLLLYS